MSYSISISAIFTTSSVKMTPRGGARPSTRSSPQIACATSPEASTVAATKSIASRARSRLLTLTFTPGLISSFPGTAGLLPFISFSTSYPELDFAALRPSCGRSLENGLCRRVLPMESWLLHPGFERDGESSQ